METLNDYGKLLLTNTMSDLVELFNINSDNGSLVDSLLSYTVDTGIFRTGEEKVNNLSIGPHNSIALQISALNEVRFSGFMFYFKSIHKVFTETLTANLTSYKDSKLHLLYLKPDKTFLVTDTKYTGEDDYLLVAKFVITSSNVLQFYVIARNAGTNQFDRSGVKYNVLDGIVPSAKSGKTITLSDGKIKYSGINILSDINTDVLIEEFDNATIPLRYVTAYNVVDWTANSTNDIDVSHIADYSAHTISSVTSGKYICQKAFYEYNTQSVVMQYGTIIYDSYNEALAGASSFNYDEPDWDGLYIPIAVFVIKAGASDLTDDENFHVISITNNSNLSAATAVDPTAQALANTALQTAQNAATAASTADGKAVTAQGRADDAYTLANTANTKATTATTNLSTHTSNTNNPHNVTKAQIGLTNVDNTADANKPLSTPQKSYVDGKVTDLTTLINTKASNATQTKTVVKATQPTNTDFGRAPIKGDIWIIP